MKKFHLFVHYRVFLQSASDYVILNISLSKLIGERLISFWSEPDLCLGGINHGLTKFKQLKLNLDYRKKEEQRIKLSTKGNIIIANQSVNSQTLGLFFCFENDWATIWKNFNTFLLPQTGKHYFPTNVRK